MEPETAKFGKPEKLADGKRVRVSVEVFGKKLTEFGDLDGRKLGMGILIHIENLV